MPEWLLPITVLDVALAAMLGTVCLGRSDSSISEEYHCIYCCITVYMFVIVYKVVYCIYGCMFCMLLFNFVNYVILLSFIFLCMFYSVYSVSLCCSVYCLCVNVYCTAATG